MSVFESKVWKRCLAVAYGLGAAVVILGALFKILHLTGANVMLMAGMLTEVFIFAISAFEPLPKEYHWETVFPEFNDKNGNHDSPNQEGGSGGGRPRRIQGGGGYTDVIDKSTADDLKSGIKTFSESISRMSGVANLAEAASELTGKIHAASGSFVSLGDSANNLADSYSKNAQSIQHLSEQSKLGLEQIHSGYEYYRSQLDKLGHTMGALNSSYELYLQETKRLQNDYVMLNEDLQRLLGNVNVTISETQKLGTQMVGLNNNVENLNSIYGSMLTAVNSVLNR
ncbi:MAG: gliding motility protein GldL [Prevotellaceae bacterium]|jgi:gliding motility-associated protein GldL|nr:gliding motility protein GldL [Prevotellaceae bacterium]